MKKFILIFLLTFVSLFCFAEGLNKKDKVYFERDYKKSTLGFYESTNLEKTNNYKYYILDYDYMSKEEVIVYYVFCNDYEIIKDYFYKVREGGLRLKEPYFHFYIDSSVNLLEYSQFLPKDKEVVNIQEVFSNKDFVSGKNMIQDFHIFVIE